MTGLKAGRFLLAHGDYLGWDEAFFLQNTDGLRADLHFDFFAVNYNSLGL